MSALNRIEDRVIAMLHAQPPNTISRVLIIIPGAVNYFYNQLGRRVADALQDLRIQADVRTLAECDGPNPPVYDWCILSNLFEILVAHKNTGDGLARVRKHVLSARAGGVGLALDCVRTHWFGVLHDYHTQVGVTDTIDLGLADQSALLKPECRGLYRFIFNGLTASEREQAVAAAKPSERPFPWAFVGHLTHQRIGLVDYLVQKVDPRGFVYAPALSAYTENGPHLNQQQYEQVLRRSRYQVWCSSHDNFYMEPERFRTSLLTGSVPVKVVEDYQKVPENIPFRHLLVPRSVLAERLNLDVFEHVRGQFLKEFLAHPSLTDGFAALLARLGFRPPQPLVREPLRMAG